MDWARVAAVTGADGPGSGYLVAPRLVLTAGHVAGPVDTIVEVFRPGREGVFAGRVVWRGREDAALVEITDPAWAPVDGAVAWGRTVTHRPGLRAETWGVPDLVQRPGEPVEVAQLTGTVNPGDRMVGDRYVLNLDTATPEGRSPWGGLSGAALFAEGLLCGVIVSDPAERRHSALEAVPGYVLQRDPAFRSILDPVRLEPVELRDLLQSETVGRAGSPASLLPARRAVVAFHGRENLLGRLHTWARQPGIGGWLVHGPAGQGKTRLAHQFTTELADIGWAVGWLDTGAADLAALAETVVPVCLVVDYAESRPAQLAGLLTILARRSSAAPVKVLLLARTVGAWWDGLADLSDRIRDVLAEATVEALPVLDETAEQRQDSYRAAVTAFAGALPDRADRDWATPPLDDSSTVLAVQMTALADLLEGGTANRGESPEDRMLSHERRYWRTTATAAGLLPELGTDTLTDAIAASVLLTPPTPEAASTWLQQVPGLADQSVDRRDRVRGWLASLYPAIDDRSAFGALEPDRLGEHLVGRLLTDQTRTSVARTLAAQVEGEDAARWIVVCTRAAHHAAFADGPLPELVSRLCGENPTTLAVAALDVAPQLEYPAPVVRALDRIAADPGQPLKLLLYLSDTLPHRSHLLADTAVIVAESLVARGRTEFPSSSALAICLNNLSNRLDAVGRADEALTTIAEAVALRRGLARRWPDRFRPDLAASLSNLSLRLSNVGRSAEALQMAVEATDIRRELAKADPGAFLPELGSTLNNLSVQLAQSGNQPEALAASTEAVEIFLALGRKDPDRFRPQVAGSLNNLSLRFVELGQLDNARTTMQNAVLLRRQLAETRPDAYGSQLAGSLNNLANQLNALDRYDEALAAITEAVGIYRRLADVRPVAYRARLAMCLNNLAAALGGLERRADALVAIDEAIELRCRLAATHPKVHQADLEKSLAMRELIENT